MNGYLLINKPSGWTSHDVVARVRRTLADELKVANRKIKVGHAGTLDPLARGLLILLVGSYTKRQAEFMKLDKTYEAEVMLGATSSTDDGEGKIVPMSNQLTAISNEQRTNSKSVERALDSFIGRIEQVPPQFSAVKVGGRRAYKSARQGEVVALKARTVTVHDIRDMHYDWPKLSFKADVSSGTYIRSLARDIGQKLGVGGYLSSLRRTRIGDFRVQGAVTPDELNTQNIGGWLKSLEDKG